MSGESISNFVEGATVEVRYGETFGSEDLKLLEVDESILSEVVETGVVIKGGLNDEAVLCTSTKTFAIKYVMTSNTVLIVPPLKQPAVVKSKDSGNEFMDEERLEGKKAFASAVATGHLELVEAVPNIEHLRDVLSQRPYKEEVDTMTAEEDAYGLYTWNDLLNIVQASEHELRNALKALSAVEIRGFWRLVDEKFMQSLLEMIILNSLQHDWSLKALSEDEVFPVLNSDGYSSQIVRHCLSTYGRLVSTVSESDMIDGAQQDSRGQGVDVWELDERHICLHYAKQLLAAASKWKVDDFLDAWQQNLPTGIHCSLDLLRGEVLVQKLGSESWLHRFSVSCLPSNPADRFVALFREKPKWEWQDLEPYIRDLNAPGKSVESLLLKYTRRTQPTADAPPVFTAR